LNERFKPINPEYFFTAKSKPPSREHPPPTASGLGIMATSTGEDNATDHIEKFYGFANHRGVSFLDVTKIVPRNERAERSILRKTKN
jgi:hypothetical protein